MEYNKKIKKEYNELIEVQRMIEDEKFRYILEPIEKEIKKLKYAYDCDNLTELAEIKGKRKGLKIVEETINGIKQMIITLKDELDRYDKG